MDVYLADKRRLVTLIGQRNAEPVIKCAFMAGLPRGGSRKFHDCRI